MNSIKIKRKGKSESKKNDIAGMLAVAEVSWTEQGHGGPLKKGKKNGDSHI
jgi:hypothetical protein